jgi:chaperonin GroES
VATATSANGDSAAAKRLRPLADRVVVRASARQATTASGIAPLATSSEEPEEGVVVVVGRGRLNEHGQRVAPDVKAGDRVRYARYAGIEVTVDGVALLVLKEGDVLAVLA